MTGRSILAIALGALIGLLFCGFVGWLGDYVFPPSVLADMNPQLARTMPMPMGEILMQLIAWGGGTVLGAMLALRFADEPSPVLCWAVAGVMAIACAVLAFLSPHPVWFVILCLIAALGAGFLAGQLLLGQHPGYDYEPAAPQAYQQPEPHYEPEPQHYEPEPPAYEPPPQPYQPPAYEPPPPAYEAPPEPEGEESPKE